MALNSAGEELAAIRRLLPAALGVGITKMEISRLTGIGRPTQSFAERKRPEYRFSPLALPTAGLPLVVCHPEEEMHRALLGAIGGKGRTSRQDSTQALEPDI